MEERGFGILGTVQLTAALHSKQAGYVSWYMDHLRAKTADLHVRWQAVHGLEDFQAGIEALIAGESTPITLLIKGAECNKEFAKKLALEQQASDYQQWLSQAKLKGHSGIYKCLKAPDSAHVRPFRDVPIQQRQAMREQQWYSKLHVIDSPKQSGERERLRYEGIVQARSWQDMDIYGPSCGHEEASEATAEGLWTGRNQLRHAQEHAH